MEQRKDVLLGKTPDNLQFCPKCNVTAEHLTLHERRRRVFLFVDNRFIRKVRALLGRWKCHCCKSTFTLYPQFALPYKRYVKEHILTVSRHYVEDDRSTYRTVVRHSGLAIGYESDKGEVDERQLVGSTPWRWLSFIGSLQKSLREGLYLIRQKSPTSEVFRKTCPIHPRKYQSDERKKLLQRCMQLFYADDEYQTLFGLSIFPQFATRCC